jgi:uncharacterized protein YaiE (UPF0345 family)
MCIEFEVLTTIVTKSTIFWDIAVCSQLKGPPLCGLVMRVPGCRSRGPGSISGATRFSEKYWVFDGVHSASWIQLRSYFRRKCNGSGLEIREYCRRDPSRWLHGTLYPQKLALTSRTSGGRSVGIVRSRTQATEFSFSQLKVNRSFGGTYRLHFQDRISWVRYQHGSRYGLPKIYKQGAQLSSIMCTIVARTHRSAKHVGGNSPHYVKYSAVFVRTLGSLHAGP